MTFMVGDLVRLARGELPLCVISVSEGRNPMVRAIYLSRWSYYSKYGNGCKNKPASRFVHMSIGDLSHEQKQQLIRIRSELIQHGKQLSPFPSLIERMDEATKPLYEMVARKEEAMKPLYEWEGDNNVTLFGTKLATNSQSQFVMEVKGTGEVMVVDPKLVKEVKPFTVLIEGITSSGNSSHCVCEKGLLDKDDVFLHKTDLYIVKEVDTGQSSNIELKADDIRKLAFQ